MKLLAMGWMVQGSNHGGVKIFCTCPDWPWGSPSFLYNEYYIISGCQSGRGIALTTHPHLALRLMKE